jgi:hypothetical protein
MMGRPTIDGKIEAGKLLPAKPHFTNPVPLSHTITFDSVSSVFCLLPALFPFHEGTRRPAGIGAEREQVKRREKMKKEKIKETQ